MKFRFKKGVKRFLIAFLAIYIFFSNGNATTVYAETIADDSGEVSTNEPQYDAASSIVQVVAYYQDENGGKHILQSTSGVLINPSTVITNYHILVLSDELKVEAANHLSGILGKPVSFFDPPQAEEGEVQIEKISYQFGIVVQSDIFVGVTAQENSADMDFLVLTISEPLNNTVATVCDSNISNVNDAVATIGMPSTSYAENASFTTENVVRNEGIITAKEDGAITYSAALQYGSSGGALVDEHGRVIGITRYNGETDSQIAIPFNIIREQLVRNGRAITVDDNDYNAVIEEEPEISITDKSGLERAIAEADIIFNEGNDNVYTVDSFSALNVELQMAKKTFEKEDATQDEIDAETEKLRAAMDGLEKVKPDRTPIYIAIIIAVSVVLLAVIILIIVLILKKKEKKNKKAEANKLKTIEPNNIDTNIKRKSEVSFNTDNLNVASKAGAQIYAQFNEKEQMIKMENDENTIMAIYDDKTADDTGVLSSYLPNRINGYLYRTSKQEYIPINKEEFIVGKATSGVDYEITDNNTVSRTHIKILRRYDEFYVVDLNATNFTFVNGVKMPAGTSQKLNNNDVIHLASEEFVFVIGQ